MTSAIGKSGGTRKWVKLREVILARDAWKCQVCGEQATQVDHIVARVRGGSDDEANLQAICDGCHNAKTQWDNDTIARRLLLTMPPQVLDRIRPRAMPNPRVLAGGFPVVMQQNRNQRRSPRRPL